MCGHLLVSVGAIVIDFIIVLNDGHRLQVAVLATPLRGCYAQCSQY
jgi:hypothetical protein